MAPAATNGDAVAALDEVKVPAGVVIPPREIKALLERTAGYVARNGVVFEDRIRDREKHNPKFSFLSSNDAYYAYYQWRLSEFKAGRITAVAAGRAGEAPAEPEKPKGPPEPPEFHFSARMPNISAKDLEILRLTALFVASNGRQFMTTISQRETGNFQFDFLRPNHSLHNFFQRLIDQYTMLLRAGGVSGEGGKLQEERIRELQENIKDKYHILRRAKQRAEWVKFQDEQKQKKEEDAERERLSYAQIDWHDFVVVETVLFTEADDHTNLPPPTSLSDLQFASLEQRAMMSMNNNLRIEEAMPSEMDDFGQEAYHPVSQAMAPPPPPAQATQPDSRMRNTDEEDEEEQRIRERSEARARAQEAQAAAKGGAGPMRIKENYVPRAAARAANKAQIALCPNCKQQIPLNELEEHMRIELLDPRWKEQKAKADSRFATTNLSTADVANNLKRLASQRSDVFDGVTGQPISEEEVARRKKAATSYDGHLPDKGGVRYEQLQNVNVEEQIRAIHQKFGDKK